MRIDEVIVKPILSEKISALTEKENKVAFVVDKAICLNDSIIPYNPFAVLLPDHISEFSCHPGNMPMRQSQKVPR